MRFRTAGQLSVAICAAAVVTTSCEKEKPPPPKPTVVICEAVEREVTVKRESVGQLVARLKVNLRARVEGFLEKRNFNEGAFVKKDETLFEIQKREYQAMVQQAQGMVDVQKALLTNAQIEFDRKKLLRSKNTVSQSELDAATADRDSAKGSLEEAKAKLDKAKLDLSYTDVKSPIDGRVGLANYDVGNVVGPESGVLATVVSLDPILAEFNVAESLFLDAQEQVLDDKISMEKALGKLHVDLILSNGKKFDQPGKIVFWDNQANAAAGTILLRAEFPNPRKLLMPGQYVRVVVRSAKPLKGVVIPQVAIQSALNEKFVMVVDDKDTVVYKTVKPGYMFEESLMIEEGIEPGERVIAQGTQKVRPGVKVIVKVEPQPNAPSAASESAAPDSGKE